MYIRRENVKAVHKNANNSYLATQKHKMEILMLHTISEYKLHMRMFCHILKQKLRLILQQKCLFKQT